MKKIVRHRAIHSSARRADSADAGHFGIRQQPLQPVLQGVDLKGHINVCA